MHGEFCLKLNGMRSSSQRLTPYASCGIRSMAHGNPSDAKRLVELKAGSRGKEEGGLTSACDGIDGGAKACGRANPGVARWRRIWRRCWGLRRIMFGISVPGLIRRLGVVQRGWFFNQ